MTIEPKICAHLLCNHQVEHPELGSLCNACRVCAASTEVAPGLRCCESCDNDCEDYL